MFALLEKFSNYFVSYHIRPKLSRDVSVNLTNSKTLESKKIAIVIQGPLVLKADFTLETLRLYIKLFPTHKLILSTWNDEDSLTLDSIKELGIDILTNQKPSNGGMSNVNFQIISSAAGIKRAKYLGCEYVLKTRTDQRIYSKESILFCYSAIKRFPMLVGYDQRERIVSFNLNTFKYKPYSISDMINFGNIDDMLKYWCIKLDSRTQKDLVQPDTLLEFSQEKFAEVYFVCSFLDNIDRSIGWTLEDSWAVMSEHFCILNVNDIGLFWSKYTHKEFRHENYQAIKNKQFDFSDWLILQEDVPQDIPEYLINIKLDQLEDF